MVFGVKIKSQKSKKSKKNNKPVKTNAARYNFFHLYYVLRNRKERKKNQVKAQVLIV